MSFFAHLVAIGAEAGQAALSASPIAYQKPSNKQPSCTPCAVSATVQRAEQRTAAATGRAPKPPVVAPVRRKASR